MERLDEPSVPKLSVTLKIRISTEHKPDMIGKCCCKGWTVSCDGPPAWSPAKCDQMRIDIDFISRKVKEIIPLTAVSSSSTMLNARDIFALSGTVVEMSVLVALMFTD